MFFHQTLILYSAFASLQKVLWWAPGEGGSVTKCQHQKCVWSPSPSPEAWCWVFSTSRDLWSGHRAPAYLHRDVIPCGQALADGCERGLLNVPDASVDAIDRVVTLSLSRGLVPGRNRAGQIDSSGFDSHNLLQHWWAGSPCLLSTTFDCSVSGVNLWPLLRNSSLQSPCISSCNCWVNSISSGKDMMLFLVSGWW